MDNVLEAGSSPLWVRAKTTRGLDHRAAEEQLAFWATALVTAAPEFLEGDLAAIDDVAELVRKRVRENRGR